MPAQLAQLFAQLLGHGRSLCVLSGQDPALFEGLAQRRHEQASRAGRLQCRFLQPRSQAVGAFAQVLQGLL